MHYYAYFLLSFGLLATGCLFERDTLTITGLPQDQIKTVRLNQVKVENNQLIITGQNLHFVDEVSLKAVGFNAPFEVVEKSNTILKANKTTSSPLPLGQILELFLTSANASSITQVEFSLGNLGAANGDVLTYDTAQGRWIPRTSLGLGERSVQLTHLSRMGAIDGETLIYDEARQEWVTRLLGGLNYQGTIDPTDENEPNSPSTGDYYIANNDCDIDCINDATYDVGDWLIYSSAGNWQKISNAIGVGSFFGIQSAVDETSGDFANFKIDQLGDVDTTTTTPAVGNVLAFHDNKWVPSNQLATQVTTNTQDIASLTSSLGSKQGNLPANGTSEEYLQGNLQWGSFTTKVLSLVLTGYNKPASSSAITTSDTINSALGKLERKVDNINIGATDLSMGEFNITNVNLVDGVDVSTLATTVAGKQNAHTRLTALSGAGVSADQYLKLDSTGELVVSAALDKSTVGLGNLTNEAQIPKSSLIDNDELLDNMLPSASDKVPSQSSVKNYVDNKIMALADGSIPLDRKIVFNDTDATENITLQSPADVTTSYTLTLPPSLGTLDQVLKTDTNGNLSWFSLPSSTPITTTLTAGTGLSGGGNLSADRTFNVNVDNTTIEIPVDTLQLRAGGITNSHINASAGIEYSKLSIPSGSLSIAQTASLQDALNGKQASITTGATSEYFRGDLSRASFATDVRSVDLTGYTPATSVQAIATTDTNLTALGKLEYRLSNLTKSDVGLNNLTNDAQIPLASLADAPLGTSSTLVPSQNAVRTFVNPTVLTKSSSYTVTAADNNTLLLASGVDTIISLPAAASNNGFRVTIKRVDPTNIITVSASEFIDNRDNIFYYQDYTTVTYISDGTKWYTDNLPAGISASNDTPATCPPGFIPVPGNSELGTTGFCVAKYEMKLTGLRDQTPSQIASQATGNPLVSITAPKAFDECRNMSSVFGGTFALISNAEWMTIARNIEQVASNWSTGIIGSGVVARGWAAHTGYGDPWTNSQVAASTSSSCLYNTGANTCAATGDHLYRRTLTLSNGQVIWDFSGNVWEWADWDNTDGAATFTLGPIDCTTGWKEFNLTITESICTNHPNSLQANQYKPTSNYTSTQGLGRWHGASGGAALRGGRWASGLSAGAFALILNHSTTDASTDFGFRCSWQP